MAGEYKKHDDHLTKVTGDFTKQVADLTAAGKAKDEKIKGLEDELERFRRPVIKGTEAATIACSRPMARSPSRPTDDGLAYIDLAPVQARDPGHDLRGL